MRAAYLTTKSGPEDLVFGKLPVPRWGLDEVLVRVHATALTPTELRWFPTFSQPNGQDREFPIVLSHEFSGVVVDFGEAVEDFAVGDPVYGINDWFKNGALAEYCVAPASGLALKPVSVDHARAAAVPISAQTAWQGLFDHGQLEAGQRVLIHGAAGGVGLFAVQLAHAHGAHVTATASARHADFLRALGVDELIDYKSTPFESVVRDVDLVFDAVGGETLARSWDVIKPGGRVVTVAAQSEGTADPRARDAFFIVESRQRELAEIAAQIDTARLLVFVEDVLPFADVRKAYARAARGGMRGKIVVQVAPE